MGSLGPGCLPRLQAKYPHLMPEDKAIWERYLRRGDYLPDEVWYDVRVGDAVRVPSGAPGWMDKFAEYATRKRIDVVGRYGDDFLIIECKPRAGVVALGQLVFYPWAFRREYEVPGRVRGAVFTDSVDSDVGPLMVQLGIWVVEVGLAD